MPPPIEERTPPPARLAGACEQLGRLAADVARVHHLARRRGARRPWRVALGDASIPPLVLLRTAAALRALVGSSLGVSAVLRAAYHIDVWSDDIGPGLRLPHPFGIVVGDGTRIGARCTLMHHVTIQRGRGTAVGDHAVIANGVTVLGGSSVGEGAIVGAASVVRGEVPAHSVAVGTPARVVRAVRTEEVSP